MAEMHRVALFVTCLVNTLRPEAAFAAVRLLEAAGFEVDVPKAQSCCGQPGYNAGDFSAARAVAKDVIALLEPYDAVVVPSGSCAGMIMHHYAKLLADEPGWVSRAEAVAERTSELCAFLAPHADRLPKVEDAASVTVHDSCCSLRETGSKPAVRTLLASAGVPVTELAGSEVCCGFGGLFSVKLSEISADMGDQKLKAAVASGATTVVSADLGCLTHLEGRAAETGHALEFRHVAEVLVP